MCSSVKSWVLSHVSGMRCVFARNHESERDALILLSLSLSWFCAKTQRIPDTWDGTISEKRAAELIRRYPQGWKRGAICPLHKKDQGPYSRNVYSRNDDPRSRMREVLAVSF